MDYKKEIETILESLKRLNISRGKIEKDLRYSENYIDQTLAKGGNKRFLDALKSYLEQVLQKPITSVARETIILKSDLEKIIGNQEERLLRIEATMEVYESAIAGLLSEKKTDFSKKVGELREAVRAAVNRRFDELERKPRS